MSELLSPKDALSWLKQNPAQAAWVDVRSEEEFKTAAVPTFVNLPILNNEERHLVGLCYKEKGQDQAIQLGHKLVQPHQELRENSWLKHIDQSLGKIAVVSCWRGGLRSKTACDWIEGRGGRTFRIQGGYKAMRAELMTVLENLPPLIVLSGLTGSGKTRLLQSLQTPKTDLEEHAKHRGSTFGIRVDAPQPSQASFENLVLLDLLNEKQPVVVEDESIRIGQVQIPLVMKNRMYESPVVWVETPLEERIQFIFEEYVLEPLNLGLAHEACLERLVQCLWILRSKLGLALTQDLIISLKNAFSKETQIVESHSFWIETLLVDYYDKLYRYSFEKRPRDIIFKGNIKECKSWIQNRYDSHKP